nr:arginine-glutamic acid dipeptide repeats protein-like [Equus asinus]
MESSGNTVGGTRKRTGLGRCRHFFWLGVVFDTVGLTVLFTGIFADLFFYDLLLYLGAIIIVFSLLWWVSWYTGNIELTPEEALKSPFPVPSATTVEALRQGVGHRLSLAVCGVSTTFLRMRRRRTRRILQRRASLDMTVTGEVEKQLEEEAQDKDGMQGVRESGDAQDVCREALGPQPETVESSEAPRPAGPDASPPGPEAGLPRLIKRPSAHLVQSESTLSPPDQPVPPAILPSKSLPVVSLASTCQPLPVLTSESQLVISGASTSQPLVTLASASHLPVPLASTSQPMVPVASRSHFLLPVAAQTHLPLPVASQSHPLVPVAAQTHLALPVDSQSHPLVPVAAQTHLALPVDSQSDPPVPVAVQSHLPVPLASQSQLQNLSQASQTQPPPVQVSQAQAGATLLSLIQLLPTQPFQTQPMDLQVGPAVHDLQALDHTQQAPQSRSWVQEIAPGRASSAQEFHKQPGAQAFESLPPASQKLSQDHPDPTSPLPEAPVPATQAQQSVPPESAPTPASEKKSHPL